MNKGNILLAVGLGLMAILNSCKDDTGTLGPNVLPKSDLISAYETDADTIVTSMFLKDSTITHEVNPILIGSYNDPVFGVTKGSLYAQVEPCTEYTSAPWDFGIVDSAVLIIQLYPGALYYGGTDPLIFDVYQLDSAMNSTTAYCSNMSLPYHILMGSQQITPPQNNSINDSIRIKLNKSWFTGFTSNLEVNNNWSTNFYTLIKGIYVTPSTPLQLPGQGCLMNVVDLASSISGIVVYYHTSPGNEIGANFPIGGVADVDFVHFEHNYSTTAFGNMHPKGKQDSISAGQLMYVQAMGGVMGRLNFPNLYKNWSKLGPVVINEAVVTIPYQSTTTTIGTYTSGPPNYLYLIETDSIGGQLAVNNAPLASSTPENNSYSFVITQYIQEVIDGKIVDRGLFVLPDEQATANGVVLYGAQHGVAKSGKTTLTIYYTPLKNN